MYLNNFLLLFTKSKALLEPDLVPLPPDEVLYLIRLVAMMVQEARGLVGLTTYSHMNTRFYGEVDGEVRRENKYDIIR